MIDYRELFLSNKNLVDHISAYDSDLEKYMATYMLLQNSDVHLDFKVKENVLATLLIAKNETAIKYLFKKPFWTILDIRNVIRLVWTQSKDNKDIRTLMSNGRGVKTPRREMLKHIICSMKPWKIESSILRHSYDAWREVIDFLHIAERDFPDLVYADDGNLAHPEHFNHSPLMKTIMDGSWEPTPFIGTMREINQENAAVLLKSYPAEFHYIRSKVTITPEIALVYAERAKVGNLLRWHEQLWHPSTIDVIAERFMEHKGMVHYPYTTYFDAIYNQRELMMKSSLGRELYANLLNRADELTNRFPVPIPSPALIAVDQSSSMVSEQVKIGTVIATQLGAQLDADLVYFYGGYYGSQSSHVAEFEKIPFGTSAAIDLIDKHPPTGNTPVAQILEPYIDGTNKKELRAVILITDEGENASWRGMVFAEALERYRQIVGHDIEVWVIAVSSDHTGMSQQIVAKGFNGVRFKIDSVKHIESLFAMIATNTPTFLADQLAVSKRLKIQSYTEVEKTLLSYTKVRDGIFASVIKGACVNCGANLVAEDVMKFRFGATIKCDSCEFVMSPTLFGGSHV